MASYPCPCPSTRHRLGLSAAACHEKERHFDDSIVPNPLLKYDELARASWITRVNKVGVLPEMHPFLEWAVAQQHAKITNDIVSLCRDQATKWL